MPADVRHGDCLDVMRAMPADSVHAIVTDPPYGLTELPLPVVVKALAAWLDGDREHVPDGKGFMGRSWDAFVPPPAVWDECFRVLRPGGHIFAFAGSRTHDLMAMSIRLAGFEKRDSIAWLYASGFPKSLDVSKAIDKAAGATREVVGYDADYARRNPRGKFGLGISHDDNRQVRPAEAAISAPATPAAQQWEGWGTALKPAFEPIVVARKPLTGTVAANIQAYGTGALNIGACRVAHDAKSAAWVEKWSGHDGHPKSDGYGGNVGQQFGGTPAGRWPANVVLDGDQADALDQQSGIRRSAGDYPSDASTEGMFGQRTQGNLYADSGGASRFFPTFRYQAKAPTAERPTYTTADGRKIAHPTVKPVELMRWLVRLVTPPGGTVLEPFAGSGATVEACLLEGFDCIAIERDPDYLPLIAQRIDRQAGTLPLDRPA